MADTDEGGILQCVYWVEKDWNNGRGSVLRSQQVSQATAKRLARCGVLELLRPSGTAYFDCGLRFLNRSEMAGKGFAFDAAGAWSSTSRKPRMNCTPSSGGPNSPARRRSGPARTWTVLGC